VEGFLLDECGILQGKVRWREDAILFLPILFYLYLLCASLVPTIWLVLVMLSAHFTVTRKKFFWTS